MREKILLVFCSTAGEEDARRIARVLVEKKLAACCTSIPGARSIYHWQGKVEETSETLLLIKTTQRKYDQLEKEIKMLHTYQVPEIIAVNIETGSNAYLDWLIETMEMSG